MARKFFISIVSFFPFLVGAQFRPIPKITRIDQLITVILDIIIRIGTPVAVFMTVYAGFLFVTAQGNPTKLERARKAFLWVMVGAALLIGAFVVKEIVENTLKAVKGP